MSSLESLLPKELLKRASLRGNEYAWRIIDIPEVIKAAHDVGMVNVGGQLQFRLPKDGTCECYWVEVDTYKTVPKRLPWEKRVARSAEAASTDFARLQTEVNFIEEGKRAFAQRLQQAEEEGVNLDETMCFVWYALDEQEAAQLEGSESRLPKS